jgi:tetratricopeptide (TPR) repeat protein
MARSTKPKPSAAQGVGPYVLLGLTVSTALAGVLIWHFLSSTPASSPVPPPNEKPVAYVKESEAQVFGRYAGSKSCRDCHAKAFASWEHSHHGLAERPVTAALDRAAFDPPQHFKHGSETSSSRMRDGRFEIVTKGPGGSIQPFMPQRAIGVDPLVQYLIASSNGLFQSTELAWDPARKEWFNVYGEEDRQPGEWGHWTGRGMNWNFMCASCHNTRLRRNYDAATDGYATTMVEAGVGCEACHGPMADHVAWQKEHPQKGTKDPTARRLTTNQMFETCAPCHARRAELTGDLIPGALFANHYALTIVDDTDIYYPDGQVRDENYEYASLLSSRMWSAGVRCVHCHDPHSGKTILQGDALCLQCHSAPTPPAPKIDPTNHSFHKPGTPGDRCVDCHMPLTPYMQRHWRHDHGFTIPDPLLTKQFAIPNACNRCHTNQTADWSLQWTDKWYGNKMERPTRTRAQTVAKARQGDAATVPSLVALSREETIPLWRASAVNLLQRWAGQPEVSAALLQSLRDSDPMVRHMAVRSLEALSGRDARVTAEVQRLLDDPIRLVRVQAAWALRATVDTNSIAGRDLLTFLYNGADHAGGAMQLGIFLFDRGQPDQALFWLQRAIGWDGNSAPFRDTTAVVLSQVGRAEEAVQQLEAACRLAPREAVYRYRLGLALNEVQRLDLAVKSLEEAVKLDPSFGQAWYNLGLGYAQQNLLEPSLEALEKAERLSPTSSQIPYARATVLSRLGRSAEANEAMRRSETLRSQRE